MQGGQATVEAAEQPIQANQQANLQSSQATQNRDNTN
jgi:hypothetical protein